MRTIKNIVAVLSLASLLLLLFEFRIAFIGLIIFTGLWLFLDSYDKIEEDEDGQRINGEHTGAYEDNKKTELSYSHQ